MTEPDKTAQPFLMPIDDVFSVTGRGPIVLGRVERGRVKTGDAVEIVGIRPTRGAVVAELEMSRKIIPEARVGDIIGVLLHDVEKDQIERGQVLAAPGTIPAHSKFKVRIVMMTTQECGCNRPFRTGHRLQFHTRGGIIGRIEVPPGIKELTPGGMASCVVTFKKAFALSKGQVIPVSDTKGKGWHAVGSATVLEFFE